MTAGKGQREPDTPLGQRLKKLIATTGPISVADYMTHCLYDKQHGYYTNSNPIGSAGDFITAPEISQMFGELIGIWFLSVWEQTEKPMPFHLVELGPGRGTMMRDMIRAISTKPEAFAALDIHLVELNTNLRAQQKLALSDLGVPLKWHDTISELPTSAPLFIVANEFFDCLPIHQWVLHKGKWHERMVGLDDNGLFAFGLGPVRDLPTSAENLPPEGSIKEWSPASEAIFGDLANILIQQGGAGLFIDYGHMEPSYGDSLQAIRQHTKSNPLKAQGCQDLTAHVDFHALATSLHERLPHQSSDLHQMVPQITTQGDFLVSMGLLERAGQLGAGKSTEKQNTLRAAVERLAAPDQMGNLFKMLALLPPVIATPPFAKSE